MKLKNWKVKGVVLDQPVNLPKKETGTEKVIKRFPLKNGKFALEKWRNKDVFETYLMMGPSRTLKQLSEITGVGINTLRKWSRDLRWRDRLAERDTKILTQVEKLNDKLYLDQVRLRHQAVYQEVQEKAMKQIRNKQVTFESDKDAAIALDIGVKGEREVLGQRGANIKAALMKDGFAAILEAVIGS